MLELVALMSSVHNTPHFQAVELGERYSFFVLGLSFVLISKVTPLGPNVARRARDVQVPSLH